MGATFARLKNWILDEEVLTDEELDAEFNHFLTNLTPAGVDDESASLAAMRATVTPGAQSSESLATSLQGEIQRLRFVLNRLIGGTYWYDAPAISLSEANTLVSLGNQIPSNRIVSGRKDSASDFPLFLVPHGTNATVTLDGTPTSFVAQIDSTAVTVSSDVTKTGLSLAPSSQNTCLVDDARLSGQSSSKYAGEIDAEFPIITIDTVGTEISSLTGKLAVFKTSTEYFLAYVKSATELTNCMRGYFFDSADAPFTRVALSNNDTITLMRAHWIFLQAAGTLTSTANAPVYANDQPTSPATGDFWFDIPNQTWKTYNGSSYAAASAHLIGIAVVDTAGCKAARSFDFFGLYNKLNTVRLEYIDANTVRSKNLDSRISVMGAIRDFGKDFQEWEMAGDLASGLSQLSATIYYIYVTEDGDTILDSEKPYDRTADLQGFYHPYKTWRCVGQVTNDGSSNFGAKSLISYGEAVREDVSNSVRAVLITTAISPRDKLVLCDMASGAYSVYLPPAVENDGLELEIKKTSSDFTVLTIDGHGAETINGDATTTLNTQWETLKLRSDGANWHATRTIYSKETSYSATTVGFGTKAAEATTWQRIGGAIKITTRFVAGTVDGSVATFGLPGALALGTYTATTYMGAAIINSATVTKSVLGTTGGTSFNMGSDNGGGFTALAGNILAVNGDIISFSVIANISGWNG